MVAPGDAEIFCPRCRYNLRGLPTPRCPECGLTFDAEPWRTGVLREHIPTSLDRCDPWQPHLVLLRSLYELMHSALRPRWVLTKLDLNGPMGPAGLMLVFGLGWLYVLTVALVAVATCVHTGVSPYAALKSAALYWAPCALGAAVVAALLSWGMVAHPAFMRVAEPSRRQYFRMGAYWTPAAAAWVVLPLCVCLLAIPEFALSVAGLWLALPLLPVLGALVLARPARFPGRLYVRLGILAACIMLWAQGTLWGAGRLLPAALDLPSWVYF